MRRGVTALLAAVVALTAWTLPQAAGAAPIGAAPTSAARTSVARTAPVTGPATAGAARPAVTSVTRGHALPAGGRLRSANGRAVLTLHTDGELSVTVAGRTTWHTSAHGGAPILAVRINGDLRVVSHGRIVWHTNTAGSSSADRLTLSDAGTLVLTARYGTVWRSSPYWRNGCGSNPDAHRVSVDLSLQLARLCAHHQQVLVTHITSGATALGDGTPTGTWRLYAKIRNTYLHPSSGGSYHVKYWMPYDGAYGMHDSAWQKFAYGSPLYRTHGSHGCEHFPLKAITFMFSWAPIGTVVRVHG